MAVDELKLSPEEMCTVMAFSGGGSWLPGKRSNINVQLAIDGKARNYYMYTKPFST